MTFKTIAAFANDLATGRLTAEQTVTDSLAAIEDPSRQGATAFTRVFAHEARAQAKTIDAARGRSAAPSPMAGIPIAIKALFDVEGHPTTAGAAVAGDPAAGNADAVERLCRAGLIPIGHTNMTEFAFSGLGLNPHHGTPLTPWRRMEARIAGGSTSGGAVAVAEGMVPLALGSDTGGSCRIPAAFCNLTGFKPTQRRIPRGGMVPLSTTLDAVGWIAQTVDDCIATDRLLSGETEAIELPQLDASRFAIPEQIVLNDLDREVRQAFDRLVERLRLAGARVESLPIPEFDEIAVMNRLGGFAAYESFAYHRERLIALGETYDPRVRVRIERGREQTVADYARLRDARTTLVERFRRRADAFDVMLFPTVPILPPRLSDLANDEDYARINLLVLRNSSIVNMVDGCAISLPVDRAGPPVGVTLAAPAGQDHRVMGLARAVEALLE